MAKLVGPACVLCMGIAAILPTLGHARLGFLASRHAERMSIDAVDSRLLSEFAGVLGQSSLSRINRIETQLLPMYTALPKTSDGALTQAVVRYALHRFFVQQHGWYVTGLEPDGNSWNASSPTTMLKDRLPSHVLAVVEQQLGGRGFGLHELAVLAATLDDVIHSEAIERLNKAYAAHAVPVQSLATSEKVDVIVQTYMMFMLQPNAKLMSFNAKQIQRIQGLMHKVYSGWNDTMLWVRDLQSAQEYNDRMERNPFREIASQELDFAATARVVEDVGVQFGRFQNLECSSLKWTLLDMEDGESGRVLLSEFYKHTLNGGSHFKESPDYLRDLGALDESNPKRPSVVIPNYVNGRSNCLAASSFYSVCCIDECESLMVRLENRISSPSGTPEAIADFVANTHSDTVDAPRNLSVALIGRLNEISGQNGGKVPLHGRMFGQWLHHAFPRECPYPQAPASSSAQNKSTEWMKANKWSRTLSREEMESHVKLSSEGSSEDIVFFDELPWSEEEELVMIHEEPASRGSNLLRLLACFAVLASAAISVYQTGKSAWSSLPLRGESSAAFKSSHFV